MEHASRFIRTIDLGAIGEHDAVVKFRAYKALRPAVDDYDEMDIESVTVDLSGTMIDVSALLDLEELKADAWERVPTDEDIASDRADAYNDERRTA